MIAKVEISRKAQDQLRKIPKHIVRKLLLWVQDIERRGVEEVRKIPGYHDEPLRGERKGERSIRLSRSYRAIYLILGSGSLEFIRVEEVNKHEY